jgi:hypothetical protein
MRTCGILSALFFAMIAVPALAVSILYNGVAQTILISPSFVASIDPASMNARYQQYAPHLVQRALMEPDNSDALQTVLFPDDTTRATVRQLLPQVISQRSNGIASTPWEATFRTDLTTVITQMLATTPACAPEAETAISATLAGNQLPALTCAPTSAALQQQIIDTTYQVMRGAFNRITDVQPLFRYTTQDVANRINELRAGAGQSLMLPATLMIMVVAFAVRSRRQLFGWISGILLATAGLGLLLTYLGSTRTATNLDALIIQEYTQYAEMLLPLTSLINDSAFSTFIAWTTRIFLIMLGSSIIGLIITLLLPKPVANIPRTSQPLGGHMTSIGDGSTNRVKTDYETDALMANPSNTLQLPPGLDTSKLTFGRRLPKIPQPTQQITDIIPKGDYTSPIPVDGQTETLDDNNTHTQELGPKEDSRATQRTDEHRF